MICQLLDEFITNEVDKNVDVKFWRDMINTNGSCIDDDVEKNENGEEEEQKKDEEQNMNENDDGNDGDIEEEEVKVDQSKQNEKKGCRR